MFTCSFHFLAATTIDLASLDATSTERTSVNPDTDTSYSTISTDDSLSTQSEMETTDSSQTVSASLDNHIETTQQSKSTAVRTDMSSTPSGAQETSDQVSTSVFTDELPVLSTTRSESTGENSHSSTVSSYSDGTHSTSPGEVGDGTTGVAAREPSASVFTTLENKASTEPNTPSTILGNSLSSSGTTTTMNSSPGMNSGTSPETTALDEDASTTRGNDQITTEGNPVFSTVRESVTTHKETTASLSSLADLSQNDVSTTLPSGEVSTIRASNKVTTEGETTYSTTRGSEVSQEGTTVSLQTSAEVPDNDVSTTLPKISALDTTLAMQSTTVQTTKYQERTGTDSDLHPKTGIQTSTDSASLVTTFPIASELFTEEETSTLNQDLSTEEATLSGETIVDHEGTTLDFTTTGDSTLTTSKATVTLTIAKDETTKHAMTASTVNESGDEHVTSSTATSINENQASTANTVDVETISEDLMFTSRNPSSVSDTQTFVGATEGRTAAKSMIESSTVEHDQGLTTGDNRGGNTDTGIPTSPPTSRSTMSPTVRDPEVTTILQSISETEITVNPSPSQEATFTNNGMATVVSEEWTMQNGLTENIPTASITHNVLDTSTSSNHISEVEVSSYNLPTTVSENVQVVGSYYGRLKANLTWTEDLANMETNEAKQLQDKVKGDVSISPSMLEQLWVHLYSITTVPLEYMLVLIH